MSLELHVIEFSVGRKTQVMGKKQRKLNRTRKVSKTLAAGILICTPEGEQTISGFAG